MQFIRRYRWLLVGFAATLVVVGFLAFRPDKLFVDDAVDESLDDAFPTAQVAETEPQPVVTTVPSPVPTDAATPDTSTTPSPTDPTSTTPSEGPIAIGSGDFFGIDHRASGSATVYEQAGQYVLRFEDDTDIQNGPDLFVWLLPSDDYTGGIPSEYIDLGKIKGNVGGQNYELPEEFDPDVHKFVVVWCKRFAVPFAGSPLA
ncbi:MAG: DM13 domain-containing protein [Actinomycetia bacterium]|nr:DM13 domain-containing protein [Actinomycetes bacterium]